MIENYYNIIKIVSSIFASLVIGIEFSVELKKSKYRMIHNNFTSIIIILIITTIMFLWIEYGDDLLALIIDKNSNNVMFALISTLIGMFLIKISKVFSLI